MATIECKLEKGITVGSRTHRLAILKEHDAGMVIDATADSERVVVVDGQPHLVSSPNSVGLQVLRRQVVSLGDIKGPLEMEQLRLLSAEDLNRLQDHAERLEFATQLAMQTEGKLGDLSPAQKEQAKAAAIEAINMAVAASRSVTQRGRSDAEAAAHQTD